MAGEIKHKWNGTILTIMSDSGTSSCDLKGPVGDDGIRGPQGPAGIITDAEGNIIFEGMATEEYVEHRLENLEIDANVDLSNYYTRDEIDATIAELQLSGGGGGGGGGGSTNSAVLTVNNTAGWLTKVSAQGASCHVECEWSSLENELPTGDGAATIYISGVRKYSETVKQGVVSIDVAPYLVLGNNSVRLAISDVYGNTRSIIYNVNLVALKLTSIYDPATVNTGSISFSYTAYGNLDKIVYFYLDGKEIGTQEVSTSGRQRTFTIPAQSHGSHLLEVYYETTIDGMAVRSNTLVYDLICVSGDAPIIASSFSETEVTQYDTLNIRYFVYSNLLTTNIELWANGVRVNSLSVGRTEQLWTYRADTPGNLTLTIKCGSVSKTFNLYVEESDMDAEITTEDLVLHLSSYGRNNNEANPASWIYGGVNCIFNGYNWRSDGWVADENGDTVHRLTGDARLVIPLLLFSGDPRETGKTIEIEFATRNTLDYDAIVASCFNNGIGLQMTAQKATLKSAQSEIYTQYKEDERIRLAFVIEKRAEHRLVFAYLNGIMCGVIQYPDADNFTQSSPVGITFGSNLATIDIYNIRVYDNDLTRFQVLDNWIADTYDITERLNRFARNNIYNAYGEVIADNLPDNLPYMVFESDTLPEYKGNEVIISGRFVDPIDTKRSFTFNNATADVQGTSSAEYARKNYKVSYDEGITQNGKQAATFQMRADSIPTKTFTFKADVASSEGANNVELVRLYNNISPYKTPAQIANPNVRQGIDGFPIVIFHNDEFIGKYNFNNDKATPEVFGFDDNDISWEIRNNTSNRVLFKSADFSGDDWKNDFEARHPKNNEDTTKLAEFSAWVASTDQEQATNAAFIEPISIDGVTYAADTAAYRLAKFKAQINDYAELQSALFYYLFTELFLMVDSRAKNAFPTFYNNGKVCWLPYDMDTAIGINNEGSLTFGYELEDIDTTETGADVYNGQKSVFWINLRQAFGAELMAMYQKLRSDDVLSYEIVEQMFEEHQNVWPEAIWNEDAWYKYVEPLIVDNTASYLGMLQGSKEEQRKWWLYNRFRYIDSKYNAGDAQKDVITLRGYEKDDITVEPYADIYATIKYGSYLVQERALRKDGPCLLECPIDTLNDTEIYIYSASQLKSIGDVSGLKVGYADYSKATKLQDLKVGSAAAGYQNLNLEELYLGNNTLLHTVDVRNCPNLKQSVDLSGCSNIENVYFDGTAITGCSLPDGGILKVLHLPETITNLTIKNQTGITDLSIPSYTNITTLRLENVGDKIDIYSILSQMPRGSRVRLIGLDWTFSSSTQLKDFYDILERMTGLSETDGNMATAQVAGKVHVPSITRAELDNIKDRYPNISITYDKLYYEVKYQNYDTTLLYSYMAEAGTTAIDPVALGLISKPTKTGSNTITYTYSGWDKLPVVNSNMTITAQFTSKTKEYTVKFYNVDNTLLKTVTVTYGADAVYNGATPVQPDSSSSYTKFAGWFPQPLNITSDTSCRALYCLPGHKAQEITDSWETIIASIKDGSYATKYQPGNYKQTTIGDKTYLVRLVEFCADKLANDNGYATTTWMIINSSYNDPNFSRSWHSYDNGDITWADSDIRGWLNSAGRDLLPTTIRNNLKLVTKQSKFRDQYFNTNDYLFLPAISNERDNYVAFSYSYFCGMSRDSGANHYYYKASSNDNTWEQDYFKHEKNPMSPLFCI